MKASELKPGDVVGGWTVAEAVPSRVRTHPIVDVVLLELEYPAHTARYMDGCANEIEEDVPAETKRTWYRADEEVEVMR